jgi:hypothetical protein
MKIYTVLNGEIEDGTDTQIMSAADRKYVVVAVGAEGRGCSLGYIPTDMPSYEGKGWEPQNRIYEAMLGVTRKGSPKLLVGQPCDTDGVILCLRHVSGYRGVSKVFWQKDNPPRILATGRIGEGAAGNMGHNDRYIVIVPKTYQFSFDRGGRCYGKPEGYYVYVEGGVPKISQYRLDDFE